MYAMLQQVDPAAAEKIHPMIQYVASIGSFLRYRSNNFRAARRGPNYPILQLGLDCTDPGALTRRIEHRTEQMLAAGC